MNSAFACRIFALALTLTAMGSGQETPPPRLSSVEAAGYLGRTATVCGRVVRIACSPDDSRAFFTLDAPNPKGVHVLITAFDRPALAPRVGRLFLQQVCATGRITRERAGVSVWSTPGQLLAQEPRTQIPRGFEEAYTTCDEGVTVPSVVHKVSPMHTADAMRRKIHGTVLLDAVVLTTGRVGDVVVAVSLDKEFGLDDEAVRALKNWRFKPGTKEGRPVPVIVSVEMTMNIA